MENLLIIIGFAVFAVAFMMLGLSITQIRKGRDLQGDVGDNDDMKRLGLQCTSQAFREEEAAITGKECSSIGGCGANCDSCATH